MNGGLSQEEEEETYPVNDLTLEFEIFAFFGEISVSLVGIVSRLK